MAMHEYIRRMRDEKDLTQQQAAESIGCTRQTYMQIEDGNRDIQLDEIRKLAALFEIPFEDFVRERDPITVSVELEKKSAKRNKKQNTRISVPQDRVEKFKEVLLYLLEKAGARPNVGQTVLYKLLYFIDFDYYEKYEEQLIGARYQKNHYGPTPIAFKKITDEMIVSQEIEKVRSNYFSRGQTKYLPHRPADLSLLTAREIKHIDEVLARLAQKNAAGLSEYSHQDVPWIMAKDGEEIAYEAVFYRTHKTTVRNYDD